MNEKNTFEHEKDTEKVICPFFKDVNGSVITCEGLIPGTDSTTGFHGVKALKKHRRAYCDSFSFARCGLCRALLTKYD